MMYTPTPSARRPRPPGSLTRQSHSKTRLPPQPASLPSTSSSSTDTPLSDYAKQRRELARTGLARVSASPAQELGDISLGLDVGARKRMVGLGLLGEQETQPSPPPPYDGQDSVLEGDGGEASGGRTPPRQDSGVPSRKTSTSPEAVSQSQREWHVAEDDDDSQGGGRARAEGRDDWDRQDGVVVSEYDARRRMKTRQPAGPWEGATIARASPRITSPTKAQADSILSRIPSNLLPHLPELLTLLKHHPDSPLRRRPRAFTGTSASSSTTAPSTLQTEHSERLPNPLLAFSLESPAAIPSPALESPEKLFRTVRGTDSSLPFPYHHQTSQAAQIKTHGKARPKLGWMSDESEERIAALEAALAEAREGEEAQRKAAARLRRDVEKLQREFERAEERFVEAQDQQAVEALARAGRNGVQVREEWRKREGTVDRDLRTGHLERSAHRDAEGEEEIRGDIKKGEAPVSDAEDDEQEQVEDGIGWGAAARLSQSRPTAGPSMPKRRSPPTRTAGEVTRREEVPERLPFLSIGPLRSLPAATSTLDVLSLDEVSTSSSADEITSEGRTISLSKGASRKRLRARALPTMGAQAGERASIAADRRLRKTLSSQSFLAPTSRQPSVLSRRRAGNKSPLTPTLILQPPAIGDTPPAGDQAISPSLGRSVQGQKALESGKQPSRPRSAKSSRSGGIRSPSPWPSPQPSPLASPSVDARAHLDFASRTARQSTSPASRSRTASTSPRFASVSSRMASMGRYVSNHLGLSAPSSHMYLDHPPRTLGSELGSEFGDDWTADLRSIENTLNFGCQSASDDDVDDEEEEGEERYAEPPAPLPPKVSAALSSLAMALAPAAVFGGAAGDSSVPILPRGSLREPGLDYSAYELLSEAVKLRRIRWADHSPSKVREAGLTGYGSSLVSEVQGKLEGWGRAEDPWEGRDYPDDELSEGSAGKLRFTDKGKAPDNRPAMGSRQVSGDGSVALAHRRRVGKAADEVAVMAQRQTDRGEIPATGRKARVDAEWDEPTTIPGRIVSDLIILLAMGLDWAECFVIVVYRVTVDLRYGQRATLGLRGRSQRKRYYI